MLPIKKLILYSLMLSISINNLSALSFRSFIPSKAKEACYSLFLFFEGTDFEGLDEACCDLFGNEDASEMYKEKIHEFLTYLETENAQRIPIRKFKKEITTPAFSNITGIWLNEETTFSEESNSYQLYVLAHEAAHYAYHHSIKYLIFKRSAKYIPTNLMQMLVIFYSLKKAIKNQNISDLMVMSFITNTCLKIIEKKITEVAIPLANNAYAKSDEKQADLKAAEMLCEHGYEYVIEDMIKRLKSNIEQGIILLNSHDHPSFEEQLTYFQKFWAEWQQKNQKAVRG